MNSTRPRTCTGLLPRVKTDPRSLDEFAISKLLADYVEAYNTMDVIQVRRFKPSFTDFSRDLSSTQLTISDIRIVLSPDRQTAGVTLTAQYRNTFRGVGASSTPPRSSRGGPNEKAMPGSSSNSRAGAQKLVGDEAGCDLPPRRRDDPI